MKYLLLLSFVFVSCDDIQLDSLGDSKAADVNVISLPLVTDANVNNYVLSGTCADDVDRVHVDINGISDDTSCDSNEWDIAFDLTGESNGAVELVISAEKNSVIDEVNSISTTKDTNIAPVLSQSCSNSVNEDSAYSCAPSVSDSNAGDTQTFSLDSSNTCSFISINSSTGVISGTPTNSHVGSCTIAFKSNDGAVDSNIESVNLTVVNTNDTPYVSNSCASSVNEDSAYSCSPSVSDVDAGSSHTFSFDSTNTCSFLSIDSSTGAISGTPDNSDVGSCVLAFKANDGIVDSNIRTVSFTVLNTNDAPVLSQACGSSVTEDIAYSCSPSLSDVDTGDIQTYSFDSTNTCSFVSINSLTGFISGSPADDDGSSCVLAFKSNDGTVDSNIESVTLSITNVNDVPVLSLPCSSDSYVPVTYSCTPSVVDPDVGSTQTYSLVSSTCSFLSMDGSTGVVSGAPTDADIGSCSFSVQSNDGVANSNTELINLTVHTRIPMVTTWKIGDPAYGDGDLTLSLPLMTNAYYKYDFVVDWGDGSSSTVTSGVDTDKDHTYAVAGDYTVTIDGLAEAWFFYNSGDKDKLISVDEFGALGWKELEWAFAGCSNLMSFSGGRTDNVYWMGRMFSYATSLTSVDVSTFDTSNVTVMWNMFEGTASLTTLDLTSFDTSNVQYMFAMFFEATALTSLDISSFDTSKVTNMGSMFYNASSLTSLDLSHFDTSKVTSITGMFRGTSSLSSLDISSFDTSSVATMDYMFQGATSITSLDLSHFDTSNVTNMLRMFNNTSSLTSIDATGWDVSSVTSSSYIWQTTNASLVINCDQGGSPGTGDLFGESCN